MCRYCRLRSVELSKAIRAGETPPPPRAAAADPAATSGDIDLDSELAAIGQSTAGGGGSGYGGGGGDGGHGGRAMAGSASFTAAEAERAAAAAMAGGERGDQGPLRSWDDLPTTPAHTPQPPPGERLPAIFMRGAPRLLPLPRRFAWSAFCLKAVKVVVAGAAPTRCHLDYARKRLQRPCQEHHADHELGRNGKCQTWCHFAGAHILYKKDQHSAPQEGRIVNTNPASATITTNTATAEASPSQLAPFLPSGSEVMLQVVCLLLVTKSLSMVVSMVASRVRSACCLLS